MKGNTNLTNQDINIQFNKQAENFANWSAGKNPVYLEQFFNFCEIKSTDRVLDVACGPGTFSIYISKKVTDTRGIDISDKLIFMAKKSAIQLELDNVNFDLADVENLPYSNNCFSVVVCKSAFHHFKNPDVVLKEMKRCCTPGGKICIQDIVSSEENYISGFFDHLDKLVDMSHNGVLRVSDIDRLFQDNLLTKVKVFQFEAELDVDEYIAHAVQKPENIKKIRNMVTEGLKDRRLSEYLFRRNSNIYLKRSGYQITGENEVTLSSSILDSLKNI